MIDDDRLDINKEKIIDMVAKQGKQQSDTD
jgi:hypothetical protein